MQGAKIKYIISFLKGKKTIATMKKEQINKELMKP